MRLSLVPRISVWERSPSPPRRRTQRVMEEHGEENAVEPRRKERERSKRSRSRSRTPERRKKGEKRHHSRSKKHKKRRRRSPSSESASSSASSSSPPRKKHKAPHAAVRVPSHLVSALNHLFENHRCHENVMVSLGRTRSWRTQRSFPRPSYSHCHTYRLIETRLRSRPPAWRGRRHGGVY